MQRELKRVTSCSLVRPPGLTDSLTAGWKGMKLDWFALQVGRLRDVVRLSRDRLAELMYLGR